MTTERRPPVGEWDESHTAVVFIHGVGEQERGDTLMNFVSPIVRWLNDRLAQRYADRFGADRPRLDSYPREGGERAFVRVTLGDHRFELTEARWSTAFRPLPNDLLIRWSAWFLTVMWWRNWLHFIMDILAHPNRRRVGWWHVLYEVVHSLLLIAVFPVAILMGWLLIAMLWLTDAIPLPNIVPGVMASALRAFLNFIVEGIGDVAAYMEDPARRDAIRQVTEDILREYQANGACDNIIVFSHSQGTVVAYDVLSDRSNGFQKCKTLMTIGSVLSPVQQMYHGSPVFEKRLRQPLKWIFMYARYDPGPGGALSDWFQPRPDSEEVEPEQILVDNRDTITEDHVTYSVNRDQVVGRIVDEMFRPLGEQSPYYRDQTQVQTDFTERRRRVARLAFWRTATYVALVGVFAFFVWASMGTATPATSMLNGLNTIQGVKQTFGQSVKLLYRIPSSEDGSITFVPGSKTVIRDGVPALEPDTRSFVVEVVDRNDVPQIVPRTLDRIGQTKRNGAWTYTVDESRIRTGIGNLTIWSAGFRHFVIPALFAILVGLGLLILFRVYRDIIWKHFYERWQHRRHEEYRAWRQGQP